MVNKKNMKKKLIQEQREKAIVENFAKVFNKIKRLDENEISATGMIKENADIKYTIVPENIKSETKKYILDIFNECETKVSDGVNANIINGDSYNKGWNLYIKNGKVLFFDDADTVGNPISQGETTLVIRINSFNVGKEILQKLGIEYTPENFDKFLGKSFTDYFREKCGDILFELYKRKVNQVRYGGYVNENAINGDTSPNRL
jgi:predicted Zn-dependent protease with MMP-like domain